MALPSGGGTARGSLAQDELPIALDFQSLFEAAPVLEAGATEYLTKPLDVARFLQLRNEILEKEGPADVRATS